VEPVELRIDSLAAGGDGVARLPDGRAVFVPFSAPGDRIRAEIVESRARFARARVVELLEPGPARVDPVCPAFGSCGGCAWQHVSYAAQLEAKRAILVEALRRIGGIEAPCVPPVLPSPRAYGYRGRSRVRVERGRVGYLRRRSHALCAVGRCPVLVPALEDRLRELAAHPPAEDGEWELAAGAGGVRAAPLGAPGAPRIELEAAGHRIAVSSGVFAQSNALLLAELVARVGAAAGRGRLAIELFAGAGLLTVGLAARFEHVVAVESHPAALRDLRENLARAGIAGVEVVGERVERAARRLAGRRPDALVLDPPRRGVPRGTAAELVAIEPKRIVYLACDAATLARDLAELCARGFGLRALEAIDLFPQTPHVEALATLEPAEGARKPHAHRDAPAGDAG
jgi:23S rRNA (uracil1939-C5)-methyltransferase